MRIGLTGGASTPDKIVEQAQRAEADGFHALWYASAVQGDPLVAMTLAGRATRRIELGTAVLQTYPCHPLLQAQRVAAAAAAMNRPGLTLGLGPSHRSNITDLYGIDYDHPGRNTDEYIQIVSRLLTGDAVDFDGHDWSAHARAGTVNTPYPVPVLLAALSPRLLRVAAQHTSGVVLWIVPPAVIERDIRPRLDAAAAAAGRPCPRVVAGLPVVVHDDRSEAREAVAYTATIYEHEPNYQRALQRGGLSSAVEAAVVGNERQVRQQLQSVLDTGATDLWLNIVAAGHDPRSSVRRTRSLLRELLDPPEPNPDEENNDE